MYLKCSKCDHSVSLNHKFCNECGARIAHPNYNNTYGNWRVRADDSWGGNTKDLGIYTGHVDDIARMLAPAANGNILTFSLEGGIVKPVPKEVAISFDSASQTWDLTPEDRAAWAKEVFRNRPVDIGVGQYHATFIIKF